MAVGLVGMQYVALISSIKYFSGCEIFSPYLYECYPQNVE